MMEREKKKEFLTCQKRGKILLFSGEVERRKSTYKEQSKKCRVELLLN